MPSAFEKLIVTQEYPRDSQTLNGIPLNIYREILRRTNIRKYSVDYDDDDDDDDDTEFKQTQENVEVRRA